VDSDGLLGIAQGARWFAMVCMAEKLLHRRTGVLARVYVHFLLRLWHVLSKCPGHQCMQVCMLHRCLDISINIYDTIAAGCAHAPVYAQFVHSRWGRGRCLNQSKQSTCRLAWGVLFDRKEDRGVLSCDFSMFDACGSVRECMCAHTDLTCKHGSVGQGEGLFISRSSVRSRIKPRTQIHLNFSYIDPQSRVLKYY